MEAVVVVYTKPNCPLCAGLISKLTVLQPELSFTLELRDITIQPEWTAQYAQTIPVLIVNGRSFPRPSPRITAERLGALLSPALQRPPCEREKT